MANNSPPAPEATTADPRLGPERFALHPLFSAPCNDLVLLSADGVRFGFQRVFLETASEVFEGMGLLAVSNGADSSSEAMVVDEDRLPVVPLAEDAATLSLFLRFLDPREEDPQVQTYADLERLTLAADKYGVVSVARAALEANAVYFIRHFSPEVLGLALFFRIPALVTTTLLASDPKCNTDDLPCVIDDIPWRLLRLLPPSTFLRLAEDHSRTDDWSLICQEIQRERNWFSQGDQDLAYRFAMHREATVLSRKTEEERKRKECKRKECKEEFLASASSDVAGVTTATDSPAENPPSLPSRPQQSKSSPTVPTTTVFSNSTQDVCIRTRGAEFRANGALLVQHSGLFDEMIHLESGLHKRTRDGRLILELDEPASAVHRLLALVHLQAADPAVDVLEDLETLCLTAEKLLLSAIAADALNLYGARYIDTHAPDILALALIFGVRPLAVLAVAAFDQPDAQPYGCGGPCCWQNEPSWSPFDIPWRLIRRIPYPAFVRLLRCNTAIRRHDNRYDNWAMVAREMEQDANWVADAEAFVEAFDANTFLLR